MNIFSPDTLQRPPVPTHLRAIWCKSPLSSFPTRNNVRFQHGDPKIQKPVGPRPCDAAPQVSGFSARPTTTNHKGVPESKACEHDETSLGWQHWRKELGVVVEVKSLLRHIFQRRTSCRILVETRGFVTPYGSKPRVER